MKRFFNWLFARLVVDEKQPPCDAGAIASRVGDAGNGFSKWKVVVQIRHPTADYDAVHTVHWVSKTPPDVSDILRHFEARPRDFEFVDFLPNLNKQPR